MLPLNHNLSFWRNTTNVLSASFFFLSHRKNSLIYQLYFGTIGDSISIYDSRLNLLKKYILPPSQNNTTTGHVTKFLVNSINIYGFKLIYYKNTFHN